ncbi:dihydrofolate reductase family protein [Microlunatus speluncae]|uniref:dihydrofolate reductase family protein n=1 Tax=Microlunatus speluncae TaxID=2594267 RepID=UPI0012663738|nr:dihydrofolate reductase family protein [Microlunatus speluncae]
MRRIIVSIHSTANNIVTGPPSGDDTDFMQWAHPGIEDSLDALLASFDGVDTILFGRGTYQDLERKWPNVKEWPDVSEVALRIGHLVNTLPKLVATGATAPESLRWGAHEPATPFPGPGVEGRLKALKEGEGGDIITFGSPKLVQSLANAGLVDEYRILIHPVIMNEGGLLFENLNGRTDLRLVNVETFQGGAMMITYATAL